MRKTSLDISESDHRRANIASAAMGLSTGEFYRCCIKAGLDSMAQHDPKMRIAFELSTDETRMALAGRLGGLVETR